jgi:aspartyl-tRNA(Asn)/glutamyl-tRNA(Gln) amidotransferase subunit C
MSLTIEQTEAIARLARLGLEPDELAAMSRQLSTVLDYVSQLQELDTTGVVPMNHVVPLENVLADDVLRPDDPVEREAILAAFPEREGDLLKVKAVFK